MQAWFDDGGKIQIALDPAIREYDAQLARVWFKRYVSSLPSPPGMSEWKLVERLAELEAAIASADRVDNAKNMNLLSQQVRGWTDERCVAAAEKFLELTDLHPKWKPGTRCKEATKLTNSTDAKEHIETGLKILLSGPKHDEAAAALKELSKKN